MDVHFEISGSQIDGARDYQEDAFLTTYVDDEASGAKGAALCIMADGMGGHAAGNIASNLVVSTFNKSASAGFGSKNMPEALRESLLKANDALNASIAETPALDGMGCTMVAAALSKGKVWWVSVGDSHLYLIRDGKLEKKNEDHSYGGYLDRMKAQGMDVEPEAGLSRNMLMSAMTGEEIAEIDCPEKPLQLLPGDRVIVASDGLDTLNAGAILQFSAWSHSPKDCVDALLKAVEDADKPRQDNTTVIVVDVVESKVSAPPADVGGGETLAKGTPELELEETEPLGPVASGQKRVSAIDDAYVEAPRKGGKGAIIGIAAAVLVGAGAAVFYMFAGEKEPVPPLVSVPKTPPEAPPGGAAPDTDPPTGEPARVEEPASGPAVAQLPPGAPPPEFRDELKIGGFGPLMVTVPGGRFEMGSSALSVAADERPQHTVEVDPFAMSKYEVTFGQYERFAKATGRSVPDNLFMDKDTHPVVFVTWDDAWEYTRWLSEQTGETYRLPNEAQWEYAASAGRESPYWWGYEVGEGNAHCFGCETGLDPRRPTRVGRFDPNPFGLHDMLGNVAEWVHDCYHKNYQGAPSKAIVWEGGDCAYRIVRGGAYTSPPPSITVHKRRKVRSNRSYDSVGFRVVREL